MDIHTTASFGTVTGYNTGTIGNVVVRGTLLSDNTGDILGGIAGENREQGVIRNCYVNATMEAYCGMTGGIVGRNSGTGSDASVTRCTSEGTLTVLAGKNRIAGIVGRGEGPDLIKGCHSSMTIVATASGANGVGGIFGANNNNLWGHSNVTQNNIDIVNQLHRDGKVFYVLGFNEPDLKEEANMTVEQALEGWKKLCDGLDPGIKLVSPATSWPGRQWMKDFMKGVQEQGLRCDYVAAHLYVGPAPTTYVNQVKELADTYGKKVWVTEFAPRDDNAVSGRPETNSYSEEWIRDNFIEPLLTEYESMSEVFRYAWFSGSPTMAGLWTSMLVNKEGELTSLGEYYASIDPNEDILPADGVTMP
ncbi:MAG: glycoside hydrolase family protein [Bacteroides sp.]|nr:glycoside hydrolase family protein [Bacteroides sp.]